MATKLSFREKMLRDREDAIVASVNRLLAEKGKFDLLMMGSHGHGVLGNLVMGSVTTKVMAHCDTPVLVIR